MTVLIILGVLVALALVYAAWQVLGSRRAARRRLRRHDGAVAFMDSTKTRRSG